MARAEMISLSMIRTARDGRALPVSMSMADFDGLLTVPTEQPVRCALGESWPDAVKAAKFDLPAWSPAIYRDAVETRRIAANVEAVSCFVLDLDSGEPFDRVVDLVAPYYAISHTTWSHLPAVPKARIILPLLTPCPVERWAEVWSAGDRWAQSAGVHMDQSCKDPCRLYYLPATVAGSQRSADYYMAGKTDGERLSWRRLLLDNPAPERPSTFAPMRSIGLPGQSSYETGEAADYARRARGIMRSICERIASGGVGGRNDAVFAAGRRAGQLHAAGALSLVDAEAAILSAGLACGLDQREAHTAMTNGINKSKEDPPFDFSR
jgi:hypothetical protein